MEYTVTSGAISIDALIANEYVDVYPNTIAIIKVEPIDIPKSTVITPCSYNRHQLGTVISVLEEKPKKLEEERGVDKVAFLPWKSGTIEKGDVLGAIHRRRVLI